MTLEELMKAGKPDPKVMDMQARFNNAQIAVDMAYRLAKDIVYIPDVKIPNKDWKEGDASYDRYTYVEATSTEKVAALTLAARLLKSEIEKDLNDTLKVLEVKDDGAKSNPA